MMSAARVLFILPSFCAATMPLDAQADWRATEIVSTYPVFGKSGAELYASIGEHGPKIGNGTRAIAHTNFKLTWRRNYVRQGNACVLASAHPKLIITYTLPQASAPLPAAIRGSWATFIDGISRHEKVHGDQIVTMVRKIEAFSVGFTVSDDPDCRRIRVELTKRLAELSREQRQHSRDFDRLEMSDGGNIQQLVLGLVNGGREE